MERSTASPIVGGWSDNRKTGAAWVFTRSGGVWTRQGKKLVGTGAVGSACQRMSVALSAAIPAQNGTETRTYDCACGHSERINVALH